MLNNWKKGKPFFGEKPFGKGGKSQPTCEGAEADTVEELPLEILVDHGQASEDACFQGFDANSTTKLLVATVHEGVELL
ncbi:hypothetical protein R1flu_009329 [Riccia fluitans]|uniref:Uncharacterized protein n=1 Tax=Riccia fluitans TaxID=41844 RepID=A0ABD1Z1S6_9MARC